MNNAEWCIKQGYKFRELTCKCSKTGNCDYDILLNNKCMGTVKDSYSNRAITTWLDMEHVEPILDDAEKRYLSAVIKPFRNEKLEIVKHSTCNGSEEWLNFVREKGSFYLPNFKTGTMYKGMEINKKYTLEELGL